MLYRHLRLFKSCVRSCNVLTIHMARLCNSGRTRRSQLGAVTDKTVQTVKGRAAESTYGSKDIDNKVLENVYTFEYLGSILQGDGDEQADMRYRTGIAQAALSPLFHLSMEYRLSRNMKIRHLSVWPTLTHSCEAWCLMKAVPRIAL